MQLSEDAMLTRFQEAAEAVGATVKRFSKTEDAAEYLTALAGGEAVAASALPEEFLKAIAGLALALAPPEDYAQVRTGVSFALAGIAATGTLLLDLTDPTGRGATALPPVHAVFLKESSIVADLASLGPLLQELLAAPKQVYFSLTTGPSRTADIERVLTIGVHGPAELHVIIVGGE
jgi:L-lactate dehydrogenase complex protein LldG